MANFQVNPGVVDGIIEFQMTADDGSSSVTTRLDPEQAQQLVDLLGVVRKMTPGSIADEPKQGVVEAVVDPAWRVPLYKAPQGRVLILRHPGYGWLHFIFPEAEAEAVAKVLREDYGALPAAGLN